jgi:hypothetical protein
MLNARIIQFVVSGETVQRDGGILDSLRHRAAVV